jgi:tellurite resistance protein
MQDRNALAPLFTDVPMSADDVRAIAAALHDIAKTDGVHEDEEALIAALLDGLDTDLGDAEAAKIEGMTPQKLALTLVDPTLRTVAVQCAVLLAMADGKIGAEERARVTEYAAALGFSGERYAELEEKIAGWVKAGDTSALFA